MKLSNMRIVDRAIKDQQRKLLAEKRSLKDIDIEYLPTFAEPHTKDHSSSYKYHFERNHIRHFVSHNKTTSKASLEKLAVNLNVNKIVLPTSKNQKRKFQNKLNLPPLEFTTAAAEDNIQHSFKFVPPVKNTTHRTKQFLNPGVSPRKRLQNEILERQESVV
jgi:hypothetical protein